jgi:hypothetical protein
MFDYKKSTVLFRSEFVNFLDANVSIASSPVLYGLAVYTVFNVRYDDGKLYIFRLQDHYKRLCGSAKIMNFGRFEDMMTYQQFAVKITSNRMCWCVLACLSTNLSQVQKRKALLPAFRRIYTLWRSFIPSKVRMPVCLVGNEPRTTPFRRVPK